MSYYSEPYLEVVALRKEVDRLESEGEHLLSLLARVYEETENTAGALSPGLEDAIRECVTERVTAPAPSDEAR